MAIDPAEDAIRPLVQKIVQESVTNSDSITLKVYDAALDRIERYLKRMLVVCFAFLGFIGSLFGFIGWTSIDKIETSFEKTASAKLEQINVNNTKALAQIEAQGQAWAAMGAELTKRKQVVDKEWALMGKQQRALQNEFQTYFEQVRLVTNDISEDERAKFDKRLKEFWDFGNKIGLFENPPTKIEIVRAFTVDPNAHSGFAFSSDKSLLRVASVFVSSEPNLVQQLIIGRLAELNEQVKQFRNRPIADFDQPEARKKRDEIMQAINIISRAISKYLTQDFLKVHEDAPNPPETVIGADVAQNFDDLVFQWISIFHDYETRIRSLQGLEHFRVASTLVRVWQQLDVDAATRLDPAILIRRIGDAAARLDPNNRDSLRRAGQELSTEYERRRPSLASSASVPTGVQ